MASEWVKLTVKHTKPDGEPNTYVNLANASSIFPQGVGAEIWFLSGSGEEGKIQIKESTDKIIALLNEIKNPNRT